MTQPLIILSAGGTARELRDHLNRSTAVKFRGFLDDRQAGDEVIGCIADQDKFPDCLLVSALGSYRGMSRRAQILSGLPAGRFANFVDDRAAVSPGAALQHDVVVFPFSVVSAGVTLAAHVLVYHHAIVSHDCAIGAGSIVSNTACLSGGVVVGSDTYIGAGAIVKEGVAIGNHSIVAAGATVLADVPDNTIYISKHHFTPNHYWTP